MPVTSNAVAPASTEPYQLAENPLWDEQRQYVYWTDIPAGKLYRFDYATGKTENIYSREPVGGFTLQENGDLLLFRTNDIVLLNPKGEIIPVRDFSSEGTVRFNDVIADPRGRVFAGTIGREMKGGLWRLDQDGSLTHLFAGTNCSNGMGFSPDLRHFYWTCSTTRQIFQFDYDVESGALSNRTLFHAAQEIDGIPDGLTVDVKGNIWSARWGGAALLQHNAEGNIVNRVPLGVSNITSLCFAGENLDEIFVTAAQTENADSQHPTLFRTKLNVRGMKEFRSKIQIRK